MCLILTVQAPRDAHPSLVAAAASLPPGTLPVDVPHLSRWNWGNHALARATISSLEGGCACDLLADDADWNAATWSMRPEALQPLVQTLEHFLRKVAATGVTFDALWVGESPKQTADVTIDELLALARTSKLATLTRYELRPGQGARSRAS